MRKKWLETAGPARVVLASLSRKRFHGGFHAYLLLLIGGDHSGAIRKNRCLGAGFLFSHTPADNRRFPDTPVARGTTMPKCKPSQRRHPEKTPQQPRDRLAEIRAEIQDVQQQIETKRRDGRVIRTAEDFESMERADRGTDQPTVGPPDGRGDASRSRRPGEPGRQARSLAQGAGHTIKDQGRRDVTLRTTCGQVIVRATYFSRNCDRSKASKGMYPMLLLWGVQDRCTAAIVSEISKLVAMLSSLEEVEQVLSDRGRPLDFKTIRTIAYRFATRARAAQRVGALNWGETVAGRRVVLSTDGGRIRIRTTTARSQDGQGAQPLSHGLARAEAADRLRGGSDGQMDREFLAVIDRSPGRSGRGAFRVAGVLFPREFKTRTADEGRRVRRRWRPFGSGTGLGALLRRCGGADRARIWTELVDFYHAVEHPGQGGGLAAQQAGGGVGRTVTAPATAPAAERRKPRR